MEKYEFTERVVDKEAHLAKADKAWSAGAVATKLPDFRMGVEREYPVPRFTKKTFRLCRSYDRAVYVGIARMAKGMSRMANSVMIQGIDWMNTTTWTYGFRVGLTDR